MKRVHAMLLATAVTASYHSLSNAQSDERNPAIPPDEATVVDVIYHYEALFDAANHEQDVGLLRRRRAADLCAALPIPVVSAWIATVISYKIGTDGKASIEMRLSPHLTVGTYEDDAADTAATNDTRFEQTMPQFNQGWQPVAGQTVTLFGIFDKDGLDCFEDKVHSEASAMSDPDFAIHVTALFPR